MSLLSYPASSAYAKPKESANASDYLDIKRKKILCSQKCLNINNSSSRINNLTILNNKNFNNYNLYSNLYTKENLNSVCVIKDVSGNCSPLIANLNTNSTFNPFFWNYYIDPYGQLFGLTQCGYKNYVRYMETSPQQNIAPTET